MNSFTCMLYFIFGTVLDEQVCKQGVQLFMHHDGGLDYGWEVVIFRKYFRHRGNLMENVTGIKENKTNNSVINKIQWEDKQQKLHLWNRKITVGLLYSWVPHLQIQPISDWIFFFFFFLAILSLVLPRQALYHLTHTQSPSYWKNIYF
jgi:hypothetical protein